MRKGECQLFARKATRGSLADTPALLKFSAFYQYLTFSKYSRLLLLAATERAGLLGHADLSHTTVYLHLSRRHLHAAPIALEQLRVTPPPVVPRSRLLRKPSQS